MALPERIGIFGGSFNPVHNGHIKAAKSAYELLKLDRMLIIPSASPPHKKLEGNADALQRLEMARLAFGGIEGFEVLDIEVKRYGISYTVDTIKELEKLYPRAEFYLVMGSDMFLTIQDWHHADEIMNRATLVALPRREGEMQALYEHSRWLEHKYNAKVIVLDVPPIDVSSTEVRKEADGGKDLNCYIPENIARYIEQRGLYR